MCGVALSLVLGVGTDLFERGPTRADVNDAYRAGLAAGTSGSEEAWQERLEMIWWEQYFLGYEEGDAISPTLSAAVSDGFSWENGYEAGLQSVEYDIDAHYWRGWSAGYQRGRALVGGEPSDQPMAVEWGGEP